MRGISVVDPGAVPGASTIPDPIAERSRARGGNRIGGYGGETGSTRVVKTHLLPGMVPPLSGHITSANDNEALAVAA